MTGLQILGIIAGFVFIGSFIILIIILIAFFVWLIKIPDDERE